MFNTWMGKFVALNLQNVNTFEVDLALAAAINDDTWATQ